MPMPSRQSEPVLRRDIFPASPLDSRHSIQGPSHFDFGRPSHDFSRHNESNFSNEGFLPSLQEAKQRGLDQHEIEVVKQDARAIARGTVGVGVVYYLQVADVDRFAAKMRKRRVKLLLPPKTQFYGVRECALVDHDGYRLVFYSPAAMPAADESSATD